MNKTVRIALAIVSLLLAVAVALSVVLGIDAAGKAGKNMAETEFDRFTNTLRGVKSLDELNDPFLRERLVALYKGSKPLLAAMIADQAGQVVWRIPAETPYLSADRLTLVGPKSSTTSYSSQITGNINLVALYMTLPQTTIFSILRNALIVLGIYVFMVIVFLVVMSLLKPETKTVPRSYEQPIARPGPPTLRGEKPQPANTPGGTPRVLSPTPAVKPRTGDLASSRLASDVPLQTSQARVAAMAASGNSGSPGSGISGIDSPKTVASAPGIHDIEFPEMENSADSKYRAMLNSASQSKPVPDFSAPRTAGVSGMSEQQSGKASRPVASGWEQASASPSPRSSAENTARALAEFEASYRATEPGIYASSGDTVRRKSDEGARSEKGSKVQVSERQNGEAAGSASGTMRPAAPSEPQYTGPVSQTPHRTHEIWENTNHSGPSSGGFHETISPSASNIAAGSDGLPSEYTLGLYSPISGLGWERNLPEKLETEISRSQAEGGDVSLLMVSFDGLTSRDPMYPAFTASIKDYFSIRDLAFECGPGGFALILPNIDVRRAVRLTEDLLKNLKSMVSLYREPSPYLPLYMGISAAAGRTVPAAKIIREATAALQKARTDQDSHIVAFNPDPTRYRLKTEGKTAAGA